MRDLALYGRNCKDANLFSGASVTNKSTITCGIESIVGMGL